MLTDAVKSQNAPFLLRLLWRHVVRGGALVALTPAAIEVESRLWSGYWRIPWEAVEDLRYAGRGGSEPAQQPFLKIAARLAPGAGVSRLDPSLGLCRPAGGTRQEQGVLQVLGTWIRMRRENPGAIPARLDEFVAWLGENRRAAGPV